MLTKYICVLSVKHVIFVVILRPRHHVRISSRGVVKSIMENDDNTDDQLRNSVIGSKALTLPLLSLHFTPGRQLWLGETSPSSISKVALWFHPKYYWCEKADHDQRTVLHAYLFETSRNYSFEPLPLSLFCCTLLWTKIWFGLVLTSFVLIINSSVLTTIRKIERERLASRSIISTINRFWNRNNNDWSVN